MGTRRNLLFLLAFLLGMAAVLLLQSAVYRAETQHGFAHHARLAAKSRVDTHKAIDSDAADLHQYDLAEDEGRSALSKRPRPTKRTTEAQKSEAKPNNDAEADREEASDTTNPPSRHVDARAQDHEEGSQRNESWIPRVDALKPIQWTARSIYLPIGDEAKETFLAKDKRIRMEKDAQVQKLWQEWDASRCLEEVPECAFWTEIGAKTTFKKCCCEHAKLKRALFHTLDVAEAAGLQLFLDSGTLLSAMRDGGMTLVPWESDIDLGIVGVEPSLVSKAFRDLAPKGVFPQQRSGESPHRFHFQECRKKTSKNVSRNGMCEDAHYVFYASSKDEALLDTARVEIWPFWPEPFRLVHPTRKKLTVERRLVEPLVFGGRCRIWGRPCWCPGDALGYLDHEYTKDWRIPKTIHWGKNNVKSWRPLPPDAIESNTNSLEQDSTTSSPRAGRRQAHSKLARREEEVVAPDAMTTSSTDEPAVHRRRADDGEDNAAETSMSKRRKSKRKSRRSSSHEDDSSSAHKEKDDAESPSSSPPSDTSASPILRRSSDDPQDEDNRNRSRKSDRKRHKEQMARERRDAQLAKEEDAEENGAPPVTTLAERRKQEKEAARLRKKEMHRREREIQERYAAEMEERRR